jgi:hypothetical protein
MDRRTGRLIGGDTVQGRICRVLYVGNSVYITSAIRAPVTWRSLLSTLKIGYQNAFATSYTTPIFP